MKKLLAILLCFALLFSLAACSSSEEEEWGDSSNKKGSASSNKNNKDEDTFDDDEDDEGGNDITHIIIGGNGSISSGNGNISGGNGIIGGIINGGGNQGSNSTTDKETSDKVETVDPDHTTDEDHTQVVQPTMPENSSDPNGSWGEIEPIEPTNPAKPCDHEWAPANCERAKFCLKCYISEGSPEPHTGNGNTCISREVCIYCGITFGDYGDHAWGNTATCVNLKTCWRCGATEGTYTDHIPDKAPTCNRKSVCLYCNQPFGDYAEHDWTPATCQQAKSCKNCGTISGSVGSHNMVGGTCTVCGKTESLNVTVSDLAPNAYPTYTSGGRITGVSYSVRGNDLYITVKGTRTNTVGTSGTVEFGWTVYGGGYTVLQKGNSSVTTSGTSFSKTICVSGVITSSYKTYKVWVGLPN